MQGNWDNARDGSLETWRLELLTTSSGQERLGGFMEEEMFELVLQAVVGIQREEDSFVLEQSKKKKRNLTYILKNR